MESSGGRERERESWKGKKGYLLCTDLSGIVAWSCYNMHEMDGLGMGALVGMGWDGGMGVWTKGGGGLE